MYYSKLNVPSLSSNMQNMFLGLNSGARIAENEFAAMQNMSSDLYPLLSPRGERTLVQTAPTEVVSETDEEGNEVTYERELHLGGILGDVGFCAVWGKSLYYMGKKVEDFELSEGDKNLVAMGGNILIFPDAAYYNTVNGEHGFIDPGEQIKKTVSINRIVIDGDVLRPGETFTKSVEWEGLNADITGIKKITLFVCSYKEYATLPKSIPYFGGSGVSIDLAKYKNALYYPYRAVKNGDVVENITEWKKLDISELRILKEDAPDVMKNGATNIWSGNAHVRYELVGASKPYYKIPVESEVFDYVEKLSAYSGGREYCRSDVSWTLRTLPILDFVCVHDNRLWGCHYGTQINTYESVNEIYASELGDFKKWIFLGEDATLAGSAYAASVGDYGPFTGCISHRGYVLFFKEDVIYRVSGTKPANFQISKISTSGVQKGSERSLAIIDEVLFYKAKNGIYAYDGSLPSRVSAPLGDGYYTDAVGGALLSKYYVSMVQNGERELYVFDTSKGLWHAEDSSDVRYLTEFDGALYAALGDEIWCLSGKAADFFEGMREGAFDWWCESGDIGLSQPFEKYFHRLLVRMDIESGARVRVEIAADSGEFLLSGDYTAPGRANVTLPVVTPRCDRMRVRISGRGKAKIYSIYFEVERSNT